MLAETVKRLLGGSRHALMVAYAVSNLFNGLAFALGRRVSRSGARHEAIGNPLAGADYIVGVFRDYLIYGGIGEDGLSGKRVLEVGPGDNFGVALSFLVRGAAHVTCYDRHYSRRDRAKQRRVYEALRESWPTPLRSAFDALVSWKDDDIKIDPRRFSYVCGRGIERADAVLAGKRFDLIVSRSVLEHVGDLVAAFRAMDATLEPGGLMVHKADLRDHGLFSGYGGGALDFLTVPLRLYLAMTCFSGRPNRARLGDYLRELNRRGYDTRCFVTHVAGGFELVPHPPWTGTLPDPLLRRDFIADIRPRLDAPFRNSSDDELAVTGIFLAARKPG